MPRYAPTKPAMLAGYHTHAARWLCTVCCPAACGVGALCVESGGVLLCVEVSGEAGSWGL